MNDLGTWMHCSRGGVRAAWGRQRVTATIVHGAGAGDRHGRVGECELVTCTVFQASRANIDARALAEDRWIAPCRCCTHVSVKR